MACRFLAGRLERIWLAGRLSARLGVRRAQEVLDKEEKEMLAGGINNIVYVTGLAAAATVGLGAIGSALLYPPFLDALGL